MRKLSAALCLALSVCPGVAAAQPSGAPSSVSLGARLLPSLVKIIGTCGHGGESRIASGFVWGPARQVVTDMHVVTGCEPDFDVLYFVHDDAGWHQTVRQARVGKVLRAADLALLTVTDPPDAPPLQLADQPVSPDQWVQAWGFPLGIQAPTDTNLQVTFANDLFPELNSTLDDAARAALQALHFPSLDARILHLNGPLQPGDSGAPVVNAAGKVVGIGSGGLQQGAASISWAMRSEYLRALATSTDTLPNTHDASPLFAYVSGMPVKPSSGPAQSGPPSVTCGGLKLVFRGTRTLDALLVTAPNAGAVRRLAREYKVDIAAMGAAPYDIWVEPISGAAAVFPAGALPRLENGFCRADFGDAGLALLVRVTALPRDPATPEWAFALARSRWQTLIALSKAAASGLRTEAHVPGWTRQHVRDGALVRRWVLNGHDGVRVYRADIAGRGASLSVGAVGHAPDGGIPNDARLDWVRALVAVELASLPPPDRTRQEAVDAPPDDDADEAGAPRLYPVLACGQHLMRLSAVPTIGALAASAGAAADLAGAIQADAGVSLDDIAQAQLDEWGEGSSGLIALLPRGAALAQGASGMCIVSEVDGPRVAVAAYNGKPGERLAEFEAALSHDMGLTLATLTQTDATSSPGVRVAKWAGGAKDAKGEPLRVTIVQQSRETRTLLEAVVAPTGNDARYGAALAALLLSPSLAGS